MRKLIQKQGRLHTACFTYSLFYHDGNRHCSTYLQQLLTITSSFSFMKLKEFIAANFHYLIRIRLFNHLHITGTDPTLHSILIFICVWNWCNHILFQVLCGISWDKMSSVIFFCYYFVKFMYQGNTIQSHSVFYFDRTCNIIVYSEVCSRTCQWKHPWPIFLYLKAFC